MLTRCLSFSPTLAAPLALVTASSGCEERVVTSPEPAAIEVRDAQGVITARVIAGHPCRAIVDGVELLVGGPPLIAQVGATRWTGEDGEAGTSLKRNDVPVARIHAKQLFDAEGAPLLRVLPDGGITNAAGAVVRTAKVTPAGVTVGDVVVANTNDVVLAAMLTAREASPEVRALAACHLLLPPNAKAL